MTIDLDASDDPTHGQQILSAFHGYFDQHQYFPLFAFEGVAPTVHPTAYVAPTATLVGDDERVVTLAAPGHPAALMGAAGARAFRHIG